MSKPTFPDHIRRIYGSSRAFKAAKRRDLRRLEKALCQLRRGAAYLPCCARQVTEIQKQVGILQLNLNAKAWGR